MKKRIFCALIAALCLFGAALPVSALNVGDYMGDVLHTDIVAYIDGYPIRSYNIAWNTYIVAEDLLEYGFHVEWRDAERKLLIHPDRTAAPAAYTTKYTPEKTTAPSGTKAMEYVYTDITTWICGDQVTGYNINGSTCICVDDLAKYFAKEYVYTDADRTLRLTTASGASAPAQNKDEKAAAAAVEEYISAFVSAGKKADFTDTDVKAMQELKALAGDAASKYVTDAVKAFCSDITYTVGAASVSGSTASVKADIRARDMSDLLSDMVAQLQKELADAEKAGKSYDAEVEVYRVLYEQMSDKSRPFATASISVKVAKSGDAWTVSETGNDDLTNALLGGMLDDALLAEYKDSIA